MSKKKKKIRPQPESLGLPRIGVESHAHIGPKHFGDDFPAVLERAAAAGLERIGNVFLGPEDYETNAELFADHPEVFFILGMHPNDVGEIGPADSDAGKDVLERMRKAFAADSRLRAVGEIGLDFYWKDVPPDLQREWFIAQLELAKELDKPVVIHSRDADQESLEMLEEFGWAGRPLLWHCFGGNTDMAARIVANGWHISVPGPVTYSKNEAVQEAVPTIPADRLLIETDSPYLAPEPYRGKPNEPAYIVFTAAHIAKLRGVEPEEIWRLTSENARCFFGIQ
ncbi:MAG: TatD family hydrolase [Desulfovibrio sp.]|uniref:TatD family hydrolase n=1 Tax=Desulfovibrio sp. 7SRBS1 TaxID=3378064 RepID=UPI003B3C2BAD